MRRLLAVVALLAVGAGQAISGQQSKPEATANVAGKWAMTLEMSMGTGTPTLEVKQDGEKITGTYSGRYGTFALEGAIKGRAIEFAVTMSAEDQTVTMRFAGEVAADGQTMKGTAALADLGEATWTAKKEKAFDPQP